jgi:hypothetical protein
LTPTFKKGFTRTIKYYAIGFALVYLSYLAFGHQYIHGPGLHHIVGLFILLGGAGWIVYNIIRLIYNKGDKGNVGSLIMNIVVISGVTIYLTVDANKNTGAATVTNKADMKTIIYNKDSNANSVSVINGLGDTLFSKVGDSILIDSTKAVKKQ